MRHLYTWQLAGVAAAFLIVLSGCSDMQPSPKMAQVKTETVSRAILFDGKSVKLSPRELEGLAAFVHVAPASAISYVELVADTANALAVSRIKKIKDYLVKQGIAHDVIRVHGLEGSDAHTVMLTIEYTRAIPPARCPDWSANPVSNYSNADLSNFGCAYYHDLIIQMADPMDFKRGRGNVFPDATRSSVVIKEYSEGKGE